MTGLTTHIPGSLRRVALPLVLAVVLGAGPARAGFCAGDRARIQTSLERLGHSLHLAAEGVKIAVRHVGLNTRTAAIQLALWTLHWQSRQLVAERLASEQPPSMADLTQALRPIWDRSVALRRGLGWQAGEAAPALEEALRQVLAARVGCRAIRAADPGACQPLVELLPVRFEGCQQDALLVGVLLSHRCEADVVEGIAAKAGVPVDALRAYCQAVSGSDPSACEQVPGLPSDEVPACEALAGRGVGACEAVAEDEKRAAACRRQVRLHDVVQGRSADWKALERDNVGVLDRAHLISGRDRSRPCAEVALLVHDLLAARFFDLHSRLGLAVPRLW